MPDDSSRRAAARARLDAKLDDGRITSAEHAARVARANQRGKASRERNQLDRGRRRAASLLASGRITLAQYGRHPGCLTPTTAEEWQPSQCPAMTTPPDPPPAPRTWKRNVLAAQAAKAAKEAARLNALRFPADFASLGELLRTIGNEAARSYGGMREVARACGVNNSLPSKWFAHPPKKIPTQEKLDLLVAWWRHRAATALLPSPAAGLPALAVRAKAVSVPQPLSLNNLPPEISQRLRIEARRRNLDPIQFAAQILNLKLRPLADLQAD